MILHVDMDAFYASVEERDRPELAGRPVVVGGTPEGRGVVAAASYAARRFGVHSAMPAATARRLCPGAVFLPSRLDYYAAVSRQIQAVFHRYTPLVEPLSLDEAFLDVTASAALFGPAADIARRIKREIRDELGLVASVGVAPNKFLAKLASDLDKPDGLVIVEAGREQAFLDPLPVSRLWGVGRVSQRLFHHLGIHTVGELRAQPLPTLKAHFGRVGEHLWELAHGRDDRTVVPDHKAKSISHETTFSDDIDNPDVLRVWLLELTEQVARRLRRHELRGHTVTIKVRFADFRTVTHARTLSRPTAITHELWQAAALLLADRLQRESDPVRLLGMGVSGIDGPGPEQMALFDQETRNKQLRLDAVADAIKARFGRGAVRLGVRPSDSNH